MATRTITHLYDTHEQAVHAVSLLEQAGIPSDDIKVVASGPGGIATEGEPSTEGAAPAGGDLGTLLSVRAEEAEMNRIEDVLAGSDRVDVGQRADGPEAPWTQDDGAIRLHSPLV